MLEVRRFKTESILDLSFVTSDPEVFAALTRALQALAEQTLQQPVTVLTHCGLGVCVDVEGVRHKGSASSSPITHPQPHGPVCPRRGPRA